MELYNSFPYRIMSINSSFFAEKLARSIHEVSRNINSVTDALIFLEVLGCDEKECKKNGFENMKTLAKHIYGFIDFFRSKRDENEIFPTPNIKIKLLESASIMFQWFGPLLLLFFTGTSFWIFQALPIGTLTALIVGSFLGIILSEGSLQAFTRILSFYHAQANMGEIKRVVKRSYMVTGLLLVSTISMIYYFFSISGIPLGFTIAVTTITTLIALHRSSFIAIYTLKKYKDLVLSYLTAFMVFSVIYFISGRYSSDVTIKYFTSLIFAFSTLFVFAFNAQSKIIGKKSASHVIPNAPHFYAPLNVKEKTLKSNFKIQFLENIPFFLFGTFFFILLFSDRIISWFFSPETLVLGGFVMPFSFNFVYHFGADIAMILIMIPTTLVQYFMMIPLYTSITNESAKLSSDNVKKMDGFFRRKYTNLLLASIVVSSFVALLLNIFVNENILIYLAGGSVTMANASIMLEILRYASLANVFLSALYITNSYFLMLFNRMKTMALITVASALILVSLGLLFASLGFQNIIFAYLSATMTAVFLSTAYTVSLMKRPSSLFFAKYM